MLVDASETGRANFDEPAHGSDEGAQLIVEREVQVAKAAGFPELHLADAEFRQAILRAVAAD